jgi:hypothetical protein
MYYAQTRQWKREGEAHICITQPFNVHDSRYVVGEEVGPWSALPRAPRDVTICSIPS